LNPPSFLNVSVLNHIAQAIETIPDVYLLHQDRSASANRTVFTFAGTPSAVVEAAFQAIKVAQEEIDMRLQKGAHPRIGATDVCPLIPVSGVSMEETAAYATKLAKRVGEELHIPTYLYEYAQPNPSRLAEWQSSSNQSVDIHRISLRTIRALHAGRRGPSDKLHLTRTVRRTPSVISANTAYISPLPPPPPPSEAHCQRGEASHTSDTPWTSGIGGLRCPSPQPPSHTHTHTPVLPVAHLEPQTDPVSERPQRSSTHVSDFSQAFARHVPMSPVVVWRLQCSRCRSSS
jgi:hypothetical protein